jgi:uncharacterized protein YjdB
LEEVVKDEFEILRELGRGGMAAVYLARDLALGRNVAIKVMAPGLLMGQGMVDRFRQEAVTIANLHHPNIVTIHTVRQAGALHFFVMHVVEEGSLEDILKRSQKIPIFLVQTILYQLGVGLSYAHRRGIIHRDIKPANVLLDRDGNAILTDFGIAKVATASNLTQTGSTIGTPAYMSPEQCRATDLTNASDQYSLGVVAYEMLTGHPPFAGSPFEIMQAHTAVDPASIRDQRPDCPHELEAAVFRMMAKNPDERFKNVAEAIEAVGGYLPGPQDPIRADLARLVKPEDGTAFTDREPLRPTPGKAVTPTPPPSRPKVVPKPPRRSRLPLWIGGAVVLAAVGTGAVMSFWPGEGAGPEVPTVQATPVAAIEFPNLTESLLVGETRRVQATITDADGVVRSEEAVEWSSSDPAVATVSGVDEEVIVTGVAAGSATILGRIGEIEESFSAEVSAPAAGELTVSAPARQVLVNGRLALSAVLTDESGTEVPGAEITWRSSNPGVLAVDPGSGVATGRSLGRAQVTASAGDQTGSVSINVVGTVEAVTINPPAGPLQAGGTTVVRTTVTARPAGYMGAEGLRWSSSNPSVATVSLSGADSVVLTLLGPGETVLTARTGTVQGAITLRVTAQAPSVSLGVSRSSLEFQAFEGGDPPPTQTVDISVTGEVTPSVGAIQYGAGGAGWLTAGIGQRTTAGGVLSLQASPSGLSEGEYTANVPVSAATESRVVEVRLTVSADPSAGPVEPTEAAAREIGTLVSEYASAINSKNTGRVREIYPSMPQQAFDDLLALRESDTYLLQLVPGSLRMGQEPGTLEGDVMSSVLGGGNRGEAVRMVYSFGRGQRGWYIVSLRPGE